MQAVIKDIIQSKTAAFHNEGLLVYELLDKAYRSQEPIEISFYGIDRCATQFLNASIGKMYLQYDPSTLNNLIRYDYGHVPHLIEKIEEVKSNAIHSKMYDALIDNATSH